jgi:hypothetical protein
MRTARARRISRREADQLLSDGPVSPDRAALRHLLNQVAAPPRPEELAGRQAAVAGFTRALRDPVPQSASTGRRPLPLFLLSRAALVKVVIGVGVLLFGGTALAAGTGNLPAEVQHGAHELFAPLGVPVPDALGRPGGGSVGGGGSVSTGTASASGATPVVTGPATVGLCRAWLARRKNGHGNVPDSAVTQALARAAGGTDNIPAYCAAVLGTDAATPPGDSDPEASPSTPAGPQTARPARSGKGKKDKPQASPSSNDQG